MKITTFDPLILTKDAESAIKLFEELGFVRTHSPVTSVETGEVPSVRMKDANGFHVDVASLPNLPVDRTMIRMNVDDYEEAYRILTEHGLKNTRGDGKVETDSAQAATMVSPSGLTIALVKHIKN